MKVETLSFAETRGELEGLYTAPSSTVRAVLVFVPGSGPATRDGIPLHERLEGIRPPFAVWAQMLAVEGYATFRYDKRAAAHAEAYRTGDIEPQGLDDEYVQDLADALAMLQTTGRVEPRPLVLVGHSLGAIAALKYARTGLSVSGVATISAPIEDMTTLLKRQLVDKLPEPSYSSFVDALDLALSGADTAPIFGLPSAYWRDLAGHPLDYLLALMPNNIPVLLLQGSDDLLIPHAQFVELTQRFRQHTNLQFVTVQGADHFLMVRKPRGVGDDGEYNLEPLLQWLHRTFNHT